MKWNSVFAELGYHIFISQKLIFLGFRSPVEPAKNFEYKAIDSQIGSLMGKRDYTVDRSQMRNQRNQNLASLVVSSGNDSYMSPNPRRGNWNDSMIFKSTNSPASMVKNSVFLNKNAITGLTDSRVLVSPGKGGKNIKLNPINPSELKSGISPTNEDCSTIKSTKKSSVKAR